MKHTQKPHNKTKQTKNKQQQTEIKSRRQTLQESTRTPWSTSGRRNVTYSLHRLLQ